MSDVAFGPDIRHVDVAILYGLGQKDRAQHIARKLRPNVVTFADFPRQDYEKFRQALRGVDWDDDQ